MGATPDIVVTYAYLETLAAQAEAAAAMLDGSSLTMNLSFPGNPEVEEAYADFVGRWDRHRDDLHTAVTSVAAAFRAVCDAFRSCEDELVAALSP